MFFIPLGIIDYWHLPKPSFWEILGSILILLLILALFYIGAKNQRAWHGSTLSSSGKGRRRSSVRITANIPIIMVNMEDKKKFKAEVADISAGGVRIKCQDPIAATARRIRIYSSVSPWKECGFPELKVLRTKLDREEGIIFLFGKWIGLSSKQKTRLKQEINKMIQDYLQK